MSEDEMKGRLDKLETMLTALLEREAVREWYTTEETAKLLGKAEFTVREWARNRRIHAEKRGSGRGKHQSWVVSHAEILRYRQFGLLPCR